VLDDQANFPDATVWATHLVDAIRFAAERGARVVNLSLGDGSHPYHPPGPEPVAAMIDAVARAHDLVVVVSTGNFPPIDYIADADIASEFVTWLLEHEQAGIPPPATAALAITTGALVADGYQGARPPRDSVDIALIGRRGGPSPATWSVWSLTWGSVRSKSLGFGYAGCEAGTRSNAWAGTTACQETQLEAFRDQTPRARRQPNGDLRAPRRSGVNPVRGDDIDVDIAEDRETGSTPRAPGATQSG
jgi:subtilisin family serine protease